MHRPTTPLGAAPAFGARARSEWEVAVRRRRDPRAGWTQARGVMCGIRGETDYWRPGSAR